MARKKPMKIGPTLFFHKGKGSWCAKFSGRFIYFGKDQKAAEALYRAELSDRMAGRDPRVEESDDDLTVLELTNRFLTTKRLLMDSGEFSARTWQKYWDMTGCLNRRLGPVAPAFLGVVYWNL